MPPDPQAKDPREETTKPAAAPTPPPAPASKPAPTAGQVEIDSILLPKKETPGATVQSAQRVSAGVLLQQEQKAGAEGLPKATSTVPAAPAAAKPKDESVVKPLETYQSDIEEVLQGGSVSAVSIAAAEAQRRAPRGAAQPPLEPTVPLRERIETFFKNFSIVGAGVALLVIAAGAIVYLALRPTTVPVEQAPAAPFILVDDTRSVTIVEGEPVHDLMDKLTAAKGSVPLSLGLIERLIPFVSSTTASGEVSTPIDAQTFLADIAPNMPPTLLRTIKSTYLLGVHVYDENQPFLILQVDSYETAFSGMLSWEYWMRSDLSPLFNYTPSPRIREAPPPVVSTTTATSTQASSTPLPLAVIQPNFIDKIVENHDARVLQNDAGDIYLLWTFLDRNTLVVTTNAATLREIISRLQNAPVTPSPGQ